MIFEGVLGSILMIFDSKWRWMSKFTFTWKLRFLFRSKSQKRAVKKSCMSELLGLNTGLFEISEMLFSMSHQLMESWILCFSLHTFQSSSSRVFLSPVVHGFRTQQLNIIDNSDPRRSLRKTLI